MGDWIAKKKVHLVETKFLPPPVVLTGESLPNLSIQPYFFFSWAYPCCSYYDLL
jgi:hypothetical protein